MLKLQRSSGGQMPRKRSNALEIILEREIRKKIGELIRKVQLAEKKCQYCKTKLGYKKKILKINSKSYAHFVCFVKADKEDEALMFYPNFFTPLDFVVDIDADSEHPIKRAV